MKGNFQAVFAIVVLVVIFSSTHVTFGLNGNQGNKSPELKFASSGFNGAKFGSAVPASCESGYNHAGECSSIDGGDLPNGPIVPTPQCPCDSAPSSCGMTNPGFGACGGVCPVPSPSDNSCVTPTIDIGGGGGGGGGSTGGGGIPTVGGGGGGGDINNNNKEIINEGQTCTIRWNASPATSCTVTGPGVNASGVSGSVTTPVMTNTTTYKITCYNGKVVASTSKFTCQIIPKYKEVGS